MQLIWWSKKYNVFLSPQQMEDVLQTKSDDLFKSAKIRIVSVQQVERIEWPATIWSWAKMQIKQRLGQSTQDYYSRG